MELEQRVALLEEKLGAAMLEAERAQAAVAVQNVMGRYQFYYSAQRQDLIATLWSKREDASNDVGGGAFLVNKAGSKPPRDPVPGLFRIHTVCTPVVEVAADCQTARAVFFSPGIDSENAGGKADCAWCWIKYGVDFIKENGQWKFWHMTAYGCFHTDYYTSWGDAPEKPLLRSQGAGPKAGMAFGAGEGFIPVDRNDWTYSINRVPELDPVPPSPYNNWQDVDGEGYRTW